MSNVTSNADGGRHHEVEIFRGSKEFEAYESAHKWKNCHKNPGHEKFLSAKVFKSLEVPKVHDVRSREGLKSCIDLTVRLRVNWTSRERPDHDGISQGSGAKSFRTGTGFIKHVYPPEINESCPCGDCGGKIKKKHWKFRVCTAHHVVYNTEEAEKTLVDLFLDDKSCEGDGGKKTVWGVKVLGCDPDGDVCHMECVTCDEDVGERIESASRCYNYGKEEGLDLAGLDLLPSCNRDFLGMIISHPHGQPKKITWGEWREVDLNNYDCVNYNVPTCPGSSGATVFSCKQNKGKFDRLYLFCPTVHSGSYKEISTQREDQLNYGFWSS